MNIFRHLTNNIIQIDNESFDLDLFLEIEPEYSLPEDVTYREYIPKKHHMMHSSNSQFSGEFPWEDGDRYLTRIPDLHLLQKTLEEDAKYVNQIKKEAEKGLKKKTRIAEYPQISELIVALWEYLVEEKPKEETIDIVQEKRLKVKEKYSK